jgi:hypothetical protein
MLKITFFCSQGALASSEKSSSRKSCARCHRSKNKILLCCYSDTGGIAVLHQTMHTDLLLQFDLRCTIVAFSVPHNSINPLQQNLRSSAGLVQGCVADPR